MKISLTQDQLEEIAYKLEMLTTNDDLQADYGITKREAEDLHASLIMCPERQGLRCWEFSKKYACLVISEIEDAILILNDCAFAANDHNEKKQSASIKALVKQLGKITEQLKSFYNGEEA